MAANIEKANTGVTIQKRRFKIFKSKKIWIIVAVVLVAIFLIARHAFSKPAGKPVNTADALKKDIVQSISVTGNIEANQEDKVYLNATQKISEVYIKEGQQVKKGTPLFKYDTSDLDGQLKKAIVTLNSAQSSYANGQSAVQDAVTQAQINVQTAQSTYDQLKRNFDANQALYDSGYISKEAYEDSKKKLSDQENQIKLLQIQLDSANKNLSDYSKSSNLKVQVDLAKADVDALNEKIADGTVTSNIDGKVIKVDAKAGQYPSADNTSVVWICDISSYKLVVPLSQYDSVRVKVGQKADLKVKGLDKKYTGSITSIGKVANMPSSVAGLSSSSASQEAKVDVEIKLDNPDENIKIGYESDADIILNEKKGALNVNFEAVQQDGKGKYVFVVENGLAKKRYVTTGLETDFDIEIIDGLKEGDKYITNPDSSIKDGEAVTVPGVVKK